MPNLKTLLLLAILASSFSIVAQNVNIPDASFKSALLANGAINTVSDGEISVAEAAAFSGSLDVSFLSITDLTGIEAFTSLAALNCSNNSLTSIDISANTALISFYCEFNSLTSIDLSSNTLLQSISVHHNQLTSLDLSQNTAVTLLYAHFNNYSALDLSANVLLETVAVGNTMLMNLDLSQNTALTSVDVSDNSVMTSMNIQNGTNALNTLSFFATGATLLACVQVDNVDNAYASWGLNVEPNTVFSLDCESTVLFSDANFKAALVSDFSINKNADGEIQLFETQGVTTINVSNQNIADLSGIESFEDLVYLDFSVNQVTSFDASPLQNLYDLNCASNLLTSLNVGENLLLNNLMCSDNQLTSLDVSGLSSLTSVNCSNNSLTTLDVSNDGGLLFLYCSNNLLTTLNISTSGLLEQLHCQDNQISTLDLTNNIFIEILNVSNNLLSTLDLVPLTALISLEMAGNQLTFVNLNSESNTNITTFAAENNPELRCIQVDDAGYSTTNWTSIDPITNFSENCAVYIPDANFLAALIADGFDVNIDGNIQFDEVASYSGSVNVSGENITDLTGIEAFVALYGLDCSNNLLTSIDVSALENLNSLKCDNNDLTALDVSNNPSLATLQCYANQIADLDVSFNPGLITLDCSVNPLGELDVTNNPSLSVLNCNSAQLSTLDLTANSNLAQLSVNDNALTELNLIGNTFINQLAATDNNLKQLNLDNNLSLNSLNVANNSLQFLVLSNHEQLNNINVSNNQLIYLDVKNNDNTTVTINAVNNLLECVQVDDVTYSQTNWGSYFDPGVTYSTNCVISFADPNFEAALVADGNIDKNVDGAIQYGEAMTLGGFLNVAAQSISDMDGIDLFINITSLDCGLNSLTALDLSKNTKLQTLSCNVNGISILDFSNNLELTSINMSDNPLVGIDVSMLPDLSSLSVANAGITAIDLTNNIQLNYLDVSGNALTNLDLSNNLDIAQLFCGGNALTSLDVSSLSSLQYLSAYNNLLESLDVTGNGSLTDLLLTNNKLKSLDLTQNTMLTQVFIAQNELIYVDIQNGYNTSLPSFIGTTNNLQCVQVDDETYANTNFAPSFDPGVTFSTSCAVNIPDANFKAVLVGDPAINLNQDAEIQFPEAMAYGGAVNAVSLTITDVTGLEVFTEVTAIDIHDNALTSVNVAYNNKLAFLNVSENQLTTLDVSENDLLTQLLASVNSLSAISLAANPQLVSVDVSNNALTSLNVISNTNLSSLSAAANQLTTIDLSANGLLTSLNLSDNDLTSIDVSALVNLSYLQISNNQLTALNLSNNENLSYLYCDGNQLPDIEIAGLPMLMELNVANNLLSALNLSGNTGLYVLNANNNNLTTLDISANTSLHLLTCDNNALLTNLNTKNGNFSNFSGFSALNNPSLLCINVDDVSYATANWTNIDAGTNYNTECGVVIPDVAFKNALVADLVLNANADNEIQFSEASAFTSPINVPALGIADLTGIEAFTGIADLDFSGNAVTTVNLSSNTQLASVIASGNGLTSLDVSALTLLTNLDCSDNALTSLDISNNTALENLYVSANQLTTLATNANTLLSYLQASENQLTSIDLSNNNALEYLMIDANPISTLDVSNLPGVLQLSCVGTAITDLDVTANTLLQMLAIDQTALTTIDLSANSALTSLSASSTGLTSLDLSANAALVFVNLSNSAGLTSLNIQNGSNVNITTFDASQSPSLYCIQVDDVSYSQTNWTLIDVSSVFSTDCNGFVTIPDTNLKTFLLADALNRNADGEIQIFEAENHSTTINVSGLGITDLTGMEAFINLQGLNCSNNNLSQIPDLSTLTSLDNLDVSSNLLEFDDLEPFAAITTFTYSPQATLGGGNDVALTVGDPFNASFTTGGSGNQYQWVLNGTDITGETTDAINIPAVTLSDAGAYELHVTNTIVTGLTLTSDPINVTVQETPISETDSLALVAIYNNQGGASWTASTNWLSGYVATWHGVTVDAGRVIALELDNNNLTGALPPDITSLTAMTTLSLAGNDISSLPDFSGLSAITTLDLSDNRLEFDDLEPIPALGYPVVTLAPQKLIGTASDITLSEGDPFNPSFAVAGTTNEYQWTLNTVALAGETSNTLNIAAVNFADAGAYQLEITNTQVAGVTLYSEIINLSVNNVPLAEGDSLALVALYNNLGGAGWTNSTNWLTDFAHTWHGVTVEDGRVVGLDLSSNNLVGSVPGDLSNLTEVTSLLLAGNQINSLPDMTALVLLETLDISNNELEFDDLEPVAALGITTLSMQPQASIAGAGDQTLVQGSTLNVSIPVGGTANEYQWALNTVDIAGATSNTLNIPAVDFADAGIYQLRITNTLVAGVTLLSDAFQLTVNSVPVNETDSLALVAMYNNLGGASWINSTNWFTGTVGTWYGVTVDGERVVGIDLSSNNLNGLAPTELANLTELTSLLLSDNQIVSLPDLSSLTLLETLDISNNQLEFDDMESLAAIAISSLTIEPQALLGNPPDQTLMEGDPFNISISVGGTANEYQWMLNAVDIVGETSSTLSVASVNLTDAGTYQLKVTNTLITGVTLYSNEFHVTVNNLPLDENDSLALVALYNNLGGASWTNDTNWLTGFAGTWHGITVEGSRVVEINLSGNSLVGALPSDVANLTGLTTLNVSNNDINGIADLSALTQLDILDVSNNLLEFDDLEPIATLGIPTMTLGPQAQITGSGNTTLMVGDDFNVSFTPPGSANVYQWTFNGANIAGATTNSLSIPSVDFADAGTYQLEVTNTLVNGVTLLSDPILLTVNNLPLATADSLALVSIYNGTGGAGWTNSSNWLAGFADTWYGVVVENGRVVELNLGGNNLQGSLPAALANLTMVTNLDLASNDITGLPDLSALSALTTLDVSGNRLDFGDLESLQALGVQTTSFGPQQEFGTAQSLTVRLTNPVTLTVDASGINNIYQWQKDGANINGANASTYSLPSAALLDAGSYTLNVTNSVVTGVILTSAPISLSIDIHNALDSLALVDFYNESGGVGWNDNSGWLDGDLNTWVGVTLNNNRVTELNLSNNDLSGSVPLALASLSELTILDLSVNNLTGEIPAELGALTNLQVLELNNNQITGTIPDALSALTSLETINLSNNELQGSIPSGFSGMSALMNAAFSFNNLTDVSALDALTSLQLLAVDHNALTFDDLEPFAGITTFTYVGQDSVGVKTKITIPSDIIYSITTSVGGTANQYTWKKDGNVIPGETASSLTITSPVSQDEGVYNFEVTNTILPDLTLLGRTTSIKVSTLMRDSVSLIALYENTGGETWGPGAGWLSENWADWDGVTIEADHVTRVELPNFGLSGAVPIDISDMLNLEVLNLSGNNITSLPNLASMPALQSVNVSGNKLDFSSLERNVSILNKINYTNQQPVGNATEPVLVPVNTDHTVAVVTGGASNNYQWYRNNVLVANGNNDALTIAAISRSNMGVYHCDVTNDVVPGLTIKSTPVTVLATAEISGQILEVGNSAVTDARVRLFGITSEGGFDSLDVVDVGVDGSYQFTNVILDDYQILAVPEGDFADNLPTYYTNTIFWEEADTINLVDNVLDLNITVQGPPSEVLDGTGVIRGFVEESEDFAGGRVMAGKRVASAGVSVRRGERSGRGQEDVFVLVAYTFTNEEGEFEFTKLPDDVYRINIQYPGYPMDTTSYVDIEVGNSLSNEVEVQATVENTGTIAVKKLLVTGLWETKDYRASVFPNPASDYIIITFDHESKSRFISVYDLNGKMTGSIPAGKLQNAIDVRSMAKGNYLLQISDQNSVVRSFHLLIE